MIWSTDIRGAILSLVAIILLYAVYRVSFLRACRAMRGILLLAGLIVAIPIIVALFRYRFNIAEQIAPFGENFSFSVHYALRLGAIALVAQLFFTTTSIGRWVDVLEWLLLPFRRLRGMLGLMILVALNYVEVIQQQHQHLLIGLRARQVGKRHLHARFAFQYCLSIVVNCTRFVNLTTLAVSARQFQYVRTPPAFSVAPWPTALLLLSTLLCALSIWYVALYAFA